MYIRRLFCMTFFLFLTSACSGTSNTNVQNPDMVVETKADVITLWCSDMIHHSTGKIVVLPVKGTRVENPPKLRTLHVTDSGIEYHPDYYLNWFSPLGTPESDPAIWHWYDGAYCVESLEEFKVGLPVISDPVAVSTIMYGQLKIWEKLDQFEVLGDEVYEKELDDLILQVQSYVDEHIPERVE